jgi:hypothetical protein
MVGVPEWLPYEFDGSRTFGEVCSDLRTIADSETRSDAHVTVLRQLGGFVSYARGSISVSIDDRLAVSGAIDGKELFSFAPCDFRGARLTTYDDADYYTLSIELAELRVLVGDAYNGLGGLPAFDVGQDHREAVIARLSTAGGALREARTHLQRLTMFVELQPGQRVKVDAAIRALDDVDIQEAWSAVQRLDLPPGPPRDSDD